MDEDNDTMNEQILLRERILIELAALRERLKMLKEKLCDDIESSLPGAAEADG